MISCFFSRVSTNTNPPRLHQHDFYEFYFSLPEDGSKNQSRKPNCVQHLVNNEIEMRPNELVLFAPEQAHICSSLLPEGAPCVVLYIDKDEFSLICEGDNEAFKILEALEKKVNGGNISIPLNAQSAQNAGKILIDIEHETKIREAGWRCSIKTKVMEFLLLIFREWNNPKKLDADLRQAAPRERMADAINYIDTHYMNPIGVEDLMQVLHMSRSHFHAIFKKETGYSFKEYLNRIRVREARKYLAKGNMPLTQIALSCGFSSHSHFCHVFRELTGRTPMKEREKGRFE